MNDQKKKWTKEIAIGGVILAGIILLLVLIIGRSGITNVRNQSSVEASTIASSTETEPETTSSSEVDGNVASSTAPSSSESSSNQYAYKEEAPSPGDNNKPETPAPQKPEEKKDTSSDTITCYIEIRCDNLANDPSKITNPEKAKYVPAGGVILPRTKVEIPKGQNVEYLIKQVCKSKGIQLTSRYHSEFKSDYVSSIGNIAEFDAGQDSGWMFSRNGIYVNTGVTNTPIKDSDVIVWNYTCDLGHDLGATM